MPRPILHDYYRSSAAYRVRIALHLKGVEFESHSVNLLKGEQAEAGYRARNPQGFVPALEIDGLVLTQSLAIIGYLDQRYPTPPLLPTAAPDRAHVLSLALMVACDMHPLNNLRVLRYLENELGVPEEQRTGWYRHWIVEGLTAMEAKAAPSAGAFLHGDAPSIADVCLVPQLYNARRFEVPLDAYPTLLRADASVAALPAFAAAHPDRQEMPQ